MMSLGKRLTISLAVSLMIFSFALASMVMLEVRKLGDETLRSRLKHDSEQLLTLLHKSADGTLMLEESGLQKIYLQPFSGHYFQIASGGITIRSRSLWDESLPQDVATADHVSGPSGQELLIYKRSYVVHGLPVTVTVAEDVSHLNAISIAFAVRLLLLFFVCILLLLALQLLFVRIGLKPLHKLRDELGRLERGEIESLQQPVPAEIAPLVDEINRLLTVMRRRLERSRYAIGNLAHALKTPLTVINQILARQPDNDDRRQLRAQVHAIQQRVLRELSHARMAGQAAGSFWSRPAEDIRDLAATLHGIYHKPIETHIEFGDDVVIRADREDMMEMVGNLLDNACKWATTRVLLRISTHPFHLVIEDDGPGMDAAMRQHASQRGVRVDEKKAGHGLGLAIVNELVSAYDGRMSMERSPLGGLKVTVLIPAV